LASQYFDKKLKPNLVNKIKPCAIFILTKWSEEFFFTNLQFLELHNSKGFFLRENLMQSRHKLHWNNEEFFAAKMIFRRSKISLFKTDNKKVVKTDKHHKLDGITENISEEIEQNKDRKIEEKKGNTETTKSVFNRCKETTKNKINDK